MAGTESGLVSTPPEIDHNWWKIWKNRRYMLAFMTFLGLMNMYMQRTCIAVAVVPMTEVRNVTNEETGRIEQEAEFDWDNAQKNFVLSSFFIGYVISMLPAGVLVKKISATPVFGIGVAVPSLITVITPLFAQNYGLLITSRVVMGLFQGVGVPCVLAFWSKWAPPLERARLHSFAMVGCAFGIVVALPLSGVLGEVNGWESIFYVTGAIGCVWWVLWLIIIRESPDTDNFISERERSYIQRSIGDRKNAPQLPIPWSSMMTSMPVWAVMIAGFTWGWGYLTISTQLPTYFSDVIGLDLGKNGALSAIPYITMTIFGVFSGYICDKILIKGWLTVTQVRKCFTSIALILQLVFILLFAHILQPAANITLITISVAFGAFTYAGFGVNYVDLGPAFASIIGGIGNTLVTGTGIFSPIVTGFIVQANKDTDKDRLEFEWRIVWYICAALYLVGAAVFWFFGSGEAQDWAKPKQLEPVEAQEKKEKE